jgi:SAM-dependent methyltransferase
LKTYQWGLIGLKLQGVISVAIFTASDLDAFVATVDSLGGVENERAKQYYEGFKYDPSTKIDCELDPFSDEYFNQQLALYKELSGRDLNQTLHEITTFPVEEHIPTPNPYGSYNPSKFAVHYLRLAFAVEKAQLPLHPEILDMGAGWGLSAEFLATLGCRVTAIDVNPAFVQLMVQRQKRHKLDIIALEGTFDEFQPTQKFDAVFFYECLHHAVKPWNLIERCCGWLTAGGKIVFAGEPINQHWWKHWGLRLDPMSVYCIRKFGWFESGWSNEFILRCFKRVGMTTEYTEINHPDVGAVCVATKTHSDQFVDAATLAEQCELVDWYTSGEFLTAKGRSKLTLNNTNSHKWVDFHLFNYRKKPLNLTVKDSTATTRFILELGRTILRFRLDEGGTTNFEFVSEEWVPAEEIGNLDRRVQSFHIGGAEFT